MRKPTAIRHFAVPLAAALVLLASTVSAQEAIRIGTSSVGSVFYTIAIGAGEVIQKHTKINTTVEPVGGSAASLNSLGANKIEFALANSFTAFWALHGKGRFKKKVRSRLVVTGQPNFRSLVVRKGSGIKSFADFKGKIIIGKRRALPEVEMVMNAMLKVHGMTGRALKIVATTNSPQTYKAMRAGSVDGAIVPYSPRSPAIEKPFRDDVIEFYDLARDKRDAAMKHLPEAFYPRTFKAGTFTKQPKDVHAFGLNTYFVARDDVPNETVYQVAKALMENTKEFMTYHRAARLWTAKRTLGDIKHPVHPGSIRYFKEKGLWTGAHTKTQAALLASQ